MFFSACSDDSNTLPYALDMDESGVGRVDEKTLFDASKINALLPGFEVASYTAFEDGHPITIMRVMRHGHEVMLISSDTEQQYVRSIKVTHPDITLFKTIKTAKPLPESYSSCIQGNNEWICHSKQTPSITLVTDNQKRIVQAIEWRSDAGH